MVATIWRSGSAGVRLGPAFLISLVLHGLLLLPWSRPRPARLTPPLEVALPPLPPAAAPALATQAVSAESEAKAVVPALEAAEKAVPPAPTSVKRVAPQKLTGRALAAALAALTKEEFYPRAAIDKGLEGRVVLLLTLDAAGRVSAVEVASSSGHLVLDDAALRAAARIGALPLGPGQALLPVEFRLE